MEVATGFLQEIRTLLEDARRYLVQAESEDPFTRDDTLQYLLKASVQLGLYTIDSGLKLIG